MARRLDWDKATKQRVATKTKRASEADVIKVHPNSMAARKWGRSTWMRRA